jgi:hypothetical protein
MRHLYGEPRWAKPKAISQSNEASRRSSGAEAGIPASQGRPDGIHLQTEQHHEEPVGDHCDCPRHTRHGWEHLPDFIEWSGWHIELELVIAYPGRLGGECRHEYV